MPKTSSTLDLVDWLANSGVLNMREAHALRRRCEELGSGVEFEQIIAGLTAQRKLTKYQAAEIRAGRHEELVQGNYLILDLIRSSQMGVVYRAQQMALHHFVALKILPEHVARAPDAEARFRREVEAIARLKHPRIVAACDAGRMGRTLYLAMEFIQGENLGDYVRRRGKLPLRDAVRCIEQAAEGLAAAHAGGIVHRDVKPSNLMLTTEGEVKVLDLGLARFLSVEKKTDNMTASEDLTGEGLLGTIDFMAPEQSRDSRKVDHRADIYGLGCTLYYLLAGAPPTPPGDWQAKLAWHESAPIPRLRNVAPTAPKELQEVFDRMMARDVRQRYASCDELRADLQKLLSQGERETPGSLRVGAAVSDCPTASLDDFQTRVVNQAQTDTLGDFELPIVNTSSPPKSQPPARPARGKPSPLVLGIAGGVGVGVLVLGLVFLVMMLMKQGPAKTTAGKQAAKSLTTKKRRAISEATNFPIGTAVEPTSKTPQGIKWNQELKAEIERIFRRGLESEPGRMAYSDGENALDQLKECDLFIGSALTVSGRAVHFHVGEGKFVSVPMVDESVDGEVLKPTLVRRIADVGLVLRSQPLLKIVESELSLDEQKNSSQRVIGTMRTEVLQDMPLENVYIVLESVNTSGDVEGFRVIYERLKWTKPESGWHDVHSVAQSKIDRRLSYRLYLIGWSWSPKPGFYRITQEYQGRFARQNEKNE